VSIRPSRQRRGIPNAGPASRSARVEREGSRPYDLTGRLAWIERDARLAVVRVQDTNRRGRAFRGRTVTVDLSQARVSVPDRDADGRHTATDLVPGERVTVRALLARKLVEPPRTVVARLVTAHDHTR
jgi:hypothetical protein